MAFRIRTRSLAVVAALVALLPATAARAQDAVEFTVKAAFLYKFGDYIEWPAGTFGSLETPVTICVGGEDPFGPALEKTVSGEKIHGHPIAVRRLVTVDVASGCHILYIAGSPQQSVAQALDVTRGTPVLTVTDEARGTGGGIIHFIKQASRVRFNIDDDAAGDNKLAISAKLFPLAAAVKTRK
jgi:hypothetical protein